MQPESSPLVKTKYSGGNGYINNSHLIMFSSLSHHIELRKQNNGIFLFCFVSRVSTFGPTPIVFHKQQEFMN